MRVFHALAPSHRAVAALALAAGVLVGEAGCLASPRDGVVFQSDWSTDTGTSRRAVTDDGRWKKYYEFNASGFQLLSVVPEGPGGRNALRVLQRGVHFAAEVEQDNVLPPSKDFYVRFYMRNDDTSQTADHAVEPGLSADFWNNLIYVRKTAAPNGWRTVVGTMNGGYPVNYWGPDATLALGAWYRFEFAIHFVDPHQIQVHPRIYDSSGTLLWSDADFRQSNYGTSPIWNGSNRWTLAAYYDAGHSFPVDPAKLVNFAMGNNGQQDAVDTGLCWYFAGVQIRTDWWAGP